MDNSTGSRRFWPIHLSSLLDKDGVLTIDLVGEDKRHVLLVSGTYLAYRKADERDLLKRLPSLQAAIASHEWLYQHPTSDFLKWLQDESFGNRSAAEVQQYTVITSNSIVDILCLDRPIVHSAPNE